MSKAVPLESLPDDETGKNRSFVEQVQDIRKFAAEELGLSITKNYTRYVKLEQDYLAAVVSASADDSFTRHEWKYPVVGAMPYKGFFKTEDAKKERAKLEKKNMDVWIRGVDAFSTLGWFKDPLYSYMQEYSPWRLADLIIHESMHATVFLKGQTKFNEELAEFVGSEGSRLYMESRFGIDSDEYQKMLFSNSDHLKFVAFIQEFIARLNVMYESNIDRAEKLSEKEKIIIAEKERFDAEYENRFESDNYRGFSNLPVNNAYLDLYRLYYTEDNFFTDLYDKSGKDLSAFIAAAKSIPNKGASRRIPPRQRLAEIMENF